MRFVQVNRGGFDNHGNIFEAMRNHGATMDPALASLIADLKANGLMLSKTLVVVLSPNSAAPRASTDNGGRDHWARVLQRLHGRWRHQGRLHCWSFRCRRHGLPANAR